MGTTEFVTKPARLRNLLYSPEIEVVGLQKVNDEILYLKWRFIKGGEELSAMTNVIVADFTTCQARLLLFEYFHTLGTRALYYDTDSIFHVSDLDRGDHELPTRSMLGELTDELADYGPGTYVVSLVLGGPKFYAYKLKNPDGFFGYTCKLKGISECPRNDSGWQRDRSGRLSHTVHSISQRPDSF